MKPPTHTEVSGNETQDNNPWFRDWFQEDYLYLYRHRDDKEAGDFLDGILPKLTPRPDGWILDVACGAGRHVHYLASLKFPVVGLDLSKSLLTRAIHSSPVQGIPWVQADMRAIPFSGNSFSVVLNLFTSFGYFEDGQDNIKVIQEVSRVLKPGGWLVLDTLNPSEVMMNLIPKSQRREGDISITEERSIDHIRHRVNKTISIKQGKQLKTYWESVRMYEVNELHRMIQSAHLIPKLLWGDYQGSEYHSLSPRIIIAAQAYATDTV
jgi:ubiquinone/menaquinone biosynthesis C-methylase UbiE